MDDRIFESAALDFHLTNLHHKTHIRSRAVHIVAAISAADLIIYFPTF